MCFLFFNSFDFSLLFILVIKAGNTYGLELANQKILKNERKKNKNKKHGAKIKEKQEFFAKGKQAGSISFKLIAVWKFKMLLISFDFF